MPSSSGAEEADKQREAEAYNWSIYLMVAVPYTCLAAIGFFVYRGLRRKALAERAAAESAGAAASPLEIHPATGSGVG